MAIRLITLGGLRGLRDGEELQRFSSQELSAALVVYLAIERVATRDALMALLWPEQDAETAAHRLSQLVYSLRKTLGEDSIDARGREVRAPESLDADAREFERAAETGDTTGAIALYHGPFLSSIHLAGTTGFENWVDRMRARYARLFRRSCRTEVERCNAASDFTGAIAAARSWVAPDPLDDEAQHHLIDQLARSGERLEALKEFASYEELLKAEGLEALDETKLLVQRIRESKTQFSAAVRAPASGGASLDARVRAGLAPDLEVIRTLGSGSTAAVYLARDPVLQRLEAIKVLKPELAADHVARLRFEREARSAARIAHTNVAHIHRLGLLEAKLPYIVMEYVDGRSLADVLASRGALPPAETRSIVAVVAAALAAAHDQGVIHRDVCPGNILIENRTGRPVLTDFGIAGLLESGSHAEDQLTPAGGTRLGDMRYMSPERLSGESLTEQSDVYSLGVVAYEMLTCQHPLRVASPMQLADAHLKHEIQPLRAVNPDVPPALASVIERCLSRVPGQRPRARDVAAMLATAS